ncbi:MAG: hypothetical protein AAFX94_16910, partial [Myxococcota bacterium]
DIRAFGGSIDRLLAGLERPAVGDENHRRVRGLGQLIQTIDGKSRVAAFEIMVNTPPVAQLIRDHETLQIKSVMELAGNMGMCLFDQSLQGLVRQGLISISDALRHSDNPEGFQV